jgi:hypothetical protein
MRDDRNAEGENFMEDRLGRIGVVRSMLPWLCTTVMLLAPAPASVLAQGADSYTTEQFYCRKAWCEPVPKIDCCWEYCAFTACNKTEPWDSAYTACTPQQHAFLTCKANSSQTGVPGGTAPSPGTTGGYSAMSGSFTEEWVGTWSVRSFHRSGPAKGGRYNSTFEVITGPGGCQVRWGKNQWACSISGNTLSFTGSHPSGGVMHWTFVRQGDQLVADQSTFRGEISGQPASGTYEGRRQ